jgi:Indigoidine synthase A like protein
MPPSQGRRLLLQRLSERARTTPEQKLVPSRVVLEQRWSAEGSQLLPRRLYASRTNVSSTSPPPPQKLLQIAPSIREALHQGRPVVALESTIVAHGMPYPQNYELSVQVNAVLRDKGVEPATIGT